MNERSEYLICTLFFVVGGIAGAGAALLFAPQRGRDTRGRLGRRLRRAAGAAREQTDRMIRRGRDRSADAALRVDDAGVMPGGNGGRKNEAVPAT
jgi:gas vesicle protein